MASRFQIEEMRAREKTRRDTAKREHKRQSTLEVEQARLQFQREEAAAQRAHELMMLERQIHLEQARAGAQPQQAAAPRGFNFGGPPAYDPALV